MLYKVSIRSQKERLIEIVRSQARMIEAVARFDQEHSNNYPDGSLAATLHQIFDAHSSFEYFGTTGELVLARREGDQIVFVLEHRHPESFQREPIPLDGDLAEPMRRALTGQSGSIIGPDYRGIRVLAAYEPVKVLDMGIVAKIDLAEVQQPYIQAALVCALIAIGVILIGSSLFIRVTNPMIRQIVESERRYRALFESSPSSIIVAKEGNVVLANQTAARFSGYDDPGKLIGTHILDLLNTESRPVAEGRMKRLAEGLPNEPTVLELKKQGGGQTLVETVSSQITLEGEPAFLIIGQDVTALEEAGAALQASERKFQSAIDSMADGVHIVDIDLNIVYCNRKFTDWLDELKFDSAILGKPIGEAFPFLPPGVFEEYDRVIRTKALVVTEETSIIANQELVTETRKIPIVIDNEVVQVMTIVRDITTRHRTTKALRESEEKFRTIFEKAADGICLADPETRQILKVNRVFSELVGWTPEELEGVDITKFHPEEALPYVFDQFDKLARQEIDTAYDIPILHKDGHIIPTDISTTIMTLGGKQYLMGMFRDVSERRIAEEQLRISQREWQDIFQAIGHPALILDQDHNILKANDATLKIMQKTHAELEGKKCFEIFHGSSEPGIPENCPLHRMKAKGHYDVTEMEMEALGKTFLVACTPIKNDSGQLEKIIHIATDISDRKRAEKALEKRVIALTRPLDDVGELSFEDLFNIDDIQKLQDEFAQATGVASIITYTDGTPITEPSNFCRLCKDIIRQTEKGRRNCFKSDAVIGRFHPGGPIVQPCMSGGLWDAGAAISVGGQHIANWLIGQVRDETQTEEKMRDYAREIGVDEETVLEAFREVPAMSREQFDQVAQALFTLANQLSTSAYQNVQQARFIAERRQAEFDLKAAKEFSESLIETANALVITLDPEGKVNTINQYTADILGYEKHELEGHNWFDLVIKEAERARMLEVFRKVVEQRPEVTRYENTVLTKDGKERLISWNNNVLKDGRGEVTNTLSIGIDITEQRRAESELDAAIKFSENLIETANTMVLTLDTKANINTFNAYAEKLTGYKKDEVIGNNWFSLFIPERDRNLIPEVFQEALKEMPEILIYQNPILCKDGTEKLISWSNNVLKNQDGDIVGLLSIGMDITERKQAEDTLKDREALLQSIFRTAPTGIGLTVERVFSWVNDRLCDMTGYSKEELTGQSTRMLYATQEDYDWVGNEKYAQIREYGTGTVEIRWRRKDGKIIDVLLSSTPLDPDDLSLGVTFTALDITDRKRAEQDLHRELRLNATVARLSDALLEPSFTIEEIANFILESAKDLTGSELGFVSAIDAETGDNVSYTLTEMLNDLRQEGEEDGKVIFPLGEDGKYPGLSGHALNTREAFYTNSPADHEAYVPLPSSHLSIQNFLCVPALFADELAGQIALANCRMGYTDYDLEAVKRIAELYALSLSRKKIEEEIRRLNEELEDRVRIRTAQLEAANQELESFSYSVSHDLRAPLRSIDGFSQALLEDYKEKLDETSSDYLMRVRNATQRMGDLIDDLLTLSRVTRSEMKEELIDLSSLADEIMGEFIRSEPERKVRFQLSRDLTVKGDKHLIRIVLENLLGNAWKFTRHREEAEITLGGETINGSRQFFVRDNGAGFDMKYASKLFGAFQRLHSDEQFEGTGIGLATVQRIINQHGGRIWAEAETGKGATFYFTL